MKSDAYQIEPVSTLHVRLRHNLEHYGSTIIRPLIPSNGVSCVCPVKLEIKTLRRWVRPCGATTLVALAFETPCGAGEYMTAAEDSNTEKEIKGMSTDSPVPILLNKFGCFSQLRWIESASIIRYNFKLFSPYTKFLGGLTHYTRVLVSFRPNTGKSFPPRGSR